MKIFNFFLRKRTKIGLSKTPEIQPDLYQDSLPTKEWKRIALTSDKQLVDPNRGYAKELTEALNEIDRLQQRIKGLESCKKNLELAIKWERCKSDNFERILKIVEHKFKDVFNEEGICKQ